MKVEDVILRAIGLHTSANQLNDLVAELAYRLLRPIVFASHSPATSFPPATSLDLIAVEQLAQPGLRRDFCPNGSWKSVAPSI